MIWIVLAVALVVAGVVLFARQQHQRDAHLSLLFRRRPAVFSPSERAFLEVLEQATGRDFRVLGKVRVSDLLMPQDGMDYGKRTNAQHTIERLHVDFVLCRPRDMAVLCAIELTDRTRARRTHPAREAFLAGACHSAGLPLITFDARYAYSAAEVSARIAEAMSAALPGQFGRLRLSDASRAPLSMTADEGAALLRVARSRHESLGPRGL